MRCVGYALVSATCGAGGRMASTAGAEGPSAPPGCARTRAAGSAGKWGPGPSRRSGGLREGHASLTRIADYFDPRGGIVPVIAPFCRAALSAQVPVARAKDFCARLRPMDHTLRALHRLRRLHDFRGFDRRRGSSCDASLPRRFTGARLYRRSNLARGPIITKRAQRIAAR